ncbi:MAG TPA: exodeoxyribonuclease VII small subunit [Rhodanobacteraceae bacterium]|nr:exodeoxyribonuclease VII small subunit [Rhodanobacteraceae bacterium]
MPKSRSKPAEPASGTSDDAVARFEQSLNELEQLVTAMEAGEMNLDESLRAFERGVALYRSCQSALDQAETRVQVLLDPEDPDTARALDPGEADRPGASRAPF